MNRSLVKARRAGMGCLLALASAAVCASLPPGATQSAANVELRFQDPAAIVSRDGFNAGRGEWLDELGRYVVSAAAGRLPEGTRLLVTVSDVQRAGMVEPWRGRFFDDVRIVRESTPPRIDLSFQLVAAQGAVLKEGRRDLSDLGFLRRTSFHRGEPLSYEKDLVDDWLRKDFGPARR